MVNMSRFNNNLRANIHEPKYERGASYPVNVRLDGDTMRLLDELMEDMQFDSYDSLFTHMVEFAHDAR